MPVPAADGRSRVAEVAVCPRLADAGGIEEARVAWRAALRVFEYEFGRAAEQPQEPFVMPTTVEEVEKLSWGQLLYLAGENAEAVGVNGTGSPSLSM